MIHFGTDDLFLVTGASSGIGRASALTLAALGGRVIAAGRDAARLAKLRDQSGGDGAIEPVTRDLAQDIEGLEGWLQGLVKSHGRLRGAVLCAGSQDIVPLGALRPEKLREVLELNTASTLALARAAADERVSIPGKTALVLVSSIAARCGFPGLTAYAASKGALIAAVRSMAVELGAQRIRVNSVSPGLVSSGIVEPVGEGYSPEALAESELRYPLGFGRAENVADAICFLLSNAAAWITGIDLVVDGGRSLA